MSAKPIIFNAAMVRALLDGSKTQTRRVIKPQPDYIESSGQWYWPLNPPHDNEGRCLFVCTASREWWEYAPRESFKYQVGGLLYVREAFISALGVGGMDENGNSIDVIYRADDGPNERTAGPWKPSIHMPRKVSRITLRITDVRVERVQDISEENARAEGLRGNAAGAWGCEGVIEDFSDLWSSINEKRGYGWEVNPWVWAISFEVIKQNVDAVIAEAGEDPAQENKGTNK